MVSDIGVIFIFICFIFAVRLSRNQAIFLHTYTHTGVPLTSHSVEWKANRAWPGREEEVGLKPRDAHLPCCTWRSRAMRGSSSCTYHYIFFFAIHLQLFVWYKHMEPFNAQLFCSKQLGLPGN